MQGISFNISASSLPHIKQSPHPVLVIPLCHMTLNIHEHVSFTSDMIYKTQNQHFVFSIRGNGYVYCPLNMFTSTHGVCSIRCFTLYIFSGQCYTGAFFMPGNISLILPIFMIYIILFTHSSEGLKRQKQIGVFEGVFFPAFPFQFRTK